MKSYFVIFGESLRSASKLPGGSLVDGLPHDYQYGNSSYGNQSVAAHADVHDHEKLF